MCEPLQLQERGAGMPQGIICLGSPDGSASRKSASLVLGAVSGPVVLPGFRVFRGSAGCRTDLLIVLFSSYLHIQFLRCGK